MIDRATVFGLVASVVGLLFVLELVRRGKLREDYSLLWLGTAIVLIVLSASRPLLDGIARVLGVVTYPPAALFLVAIIFMLFILLHFSTVLTKLARENKIIAQQMAILRWELTEAQRKLAVSASISPGAAAMLSHDQALRDDEDDQQHRAIQRDQP